MFNKFIHSSIDRFSWKLNSEQGFFSVGLGEVNKWAVNVRVTVSSALKKTKADKTGLRVRLLLYIQGAEEKLLWWSHLWEATWRKWRSERCRASGKKKCQWKERKERVSNGLHFDTVRGQVVFQSPAGTLQFSCDAGQLEEGITNPLTEHLLCAALHMWPCCNTERLWSPFTCGGRGH